MSRFFNRVEVERRPDLTIVHLIHDMEVECCICGRPTFSKLSVPYFCGPVREGCSEGGYSHACERCYARWERWNDAGMAGLRKPVHGGYPTATRAAQEDERFPCACAIGSGAYCYRHRCASRGVPVTPTATCGECSGPMLPDPAKRLKCIRCGADGVAVLNGEADHG